MMPLQKDLVITGNSGFMQPLRSKSNLEVKKEQANENIIQTETGTE